MSSFLCGYGHKHRNRCSYPTGKLKRADVKLIKARKIQIFCNATLFFPASSYACRRKNMAVGSRPLVPGLSSTTSLQSDQASFHIEANTKHISYKIIIGNKTALKPHRAQFSAMCSWYPLQDPVVSLKRRKETLALLPLKCAHHVRHEYCSRYRTPGYLKTMFWFARPIHGFKLDR